MKTFKQINSNESLDKWEVQRVLESLIVNSSEVNFKHSFKKLKEYTSVVDGRVRIIDIDKIVKKKISALSKSYSTNLRDTIKNICNNFTLTPTYLYMLLFSIL